MKVTDKESSMRRNELCWRIDGVLEDKWREKRER